MSTSESSGNLNANSDEAREDLLATLAAARELNPEMDKALAEQYLARRQEDQKRTAQRSPVTVEQPQPPAQATRQWQRPFIPVFALVMLAAILVVGVHWGDWWLLFWLPFLFGGFWWRRGWSSDDTEGGAGDPRYQRRMARQRYRQERLAARYGYRTDYSPNADDGGTAARQPDLPARTPTPTLPGPGTAPLPTAPSTSPAPLSQAGTPGPFAGGLPPANPAG